MKDKCQAMDIDGKRCKKPARQTTNVHLDNEIYNCKWVKCRLCKKHYNQLQSWDSFEL